jgi:hypothetical protein
MIEDHRRSVGVLKTCSADALQGCGAAPFLGSRLAGLFSHLPVERAVLSLTEAYTAYGHGVSQFHQRFFRIVRKLNALMPINDSLQTRHMAIEFHWKEHLLHSLCNRDLRSISA